MSTALHAPRLEHLRVQGVRLYNEGKVLDIDLRKPLAVFVGANGVGKSTLLALLNFGVTGLVPDDRVGFPSIDEWIGRTATFASKYFSGRVNENDRDSSHVTIQFQLNQAQFRITRRLFDGRLVQDFSCQLAGHATPIAADTENESQSDVTLAYQRAVIEASGFASFEQFCFWQLYLTTFDERRHLLFWDEKTLSNALMIALGRTSHDAIEAESLRRNIERQDSLARNARWRATQATNRRQRLARKSGIGELSDAEVVALQAKFGELTGKHQEARDAVERAEVAVRDTTRSIAEQTIQISELEQTYLQTFSTSPSRRDPAEHSAIRQLERDRHCDFCGASDVSLGPNATAALHADHCPLCATSLVEPQSTESIGLELSGLDTELAKARREVSGLQNRYRRLQGELDTCRKRWDAATAELSKFHGANPDATSLSQSDETRARLAQYDVEIADAMRDTEDYRKQRDDYNAKLRPIIDGLAAAYSEIETVFVPNFRGLAERFIGRTVDIELEHSGTDIGLRFSLDGQSRRTATELSESQQFFLDIALRLSIIQTFFSTPVSALIDTPEGSLDIAYEVRAGELIVRFANTGHAVVMMSNLNSSHLLTEIAKLSDSDDMDLFKMIDWVQLSDVQLESSELFQEVYEDLRKRLIAKAKL